MLVLLILVAALVALGFAVDRGLLELTKIALDKDNRMIRLGGGLNSGDWFIRVDLWSIGFRITRTSEGKGRV